MDGNERTAFAVADVFLRMNGLRLEVGDAEAFEVIVGALEAGGDRFAMFDARLRRSIA